MGFKKILSRRRRKRRNVVIAVIIIGLPIIQFWKLSWIYYYPNDKNDIPFTYYQQLLSSSSSSLTTKSFTTHKEGSVDHHPSTQSPQTIITTTNESSLMDAKLILSPFTNNQTTTTTTTELNTKNMIPHTPPVDDNYYNNNNDSSRIIQNSLYYQYKCPYLNEKQMLSQSSSIRSNEARELSLNASVIPFIQSILDRGILSGRKILFVGDSLNRQMTESLACLVGHERTTTTMEENKNNNNNTIKTKWGRTHFYRGLPINDQTTTTTTTTTTQQHEQQQQQQQQQQPLEVYYSNCAGKLISLDGSNGGYKEQSWIDIICNGNGDKKTKKKINNNYTTAAEVVGRPSSSSSSLFFTTMDPEFQKIFLSSNDFILLDATHHATRSKNLKQITQLANCLFSKNNNNNNNNNNKIKTNWPRFAVIQYTPTHWGTKTGGYEPRYRQEQLEQFKVDGDAPCIRRSHPSQRLMINKELKLLQQQQQQTMNSSHRNKDDHIPVLGQVSIKRALSLGRFHIGNGDCLHWLRPGLPDLMLKEIFEWIVDQVQVEN